MPIIKTISTGNGIAGAARVELAKLQRHIPGTDLSAPAGLEVQVHLYPTLADAHAGTNLQWQLYPALPVTAYDAADPFGSIERALIEAPGDFFGGAYAPDEVASTLDTAKACKWADMKATRDQLESGGFDLPGVGRFDSDEESRNKIIGASLAAKIARDAEQPYVIAWTLADNTVVQLDADGIIDAGFAMLAHLNAIHQRSRALYAQIQAAETLEAIAAIVWAQPTEPEQPTEVPAEA
ncbi:MAG: DUF4376 domain-containing protein [Comamonas sp.]|jgi:hypothetical protein|nr:DUF4376 domain-containing protein [Comamonas sp.]